MRAGRLVLVGFMGAGKTTVGRLVARQLGFDFVDMDERVEALAGTSVAELFAREGEAAFRRLEAEIAREVAAKTRVVVAAGGGAFAEAETRRLLQDGAFTVFLECDLDLVERRIGDGASRPLAANRAIMAGLLAAREPAYALANWRIDTSRLDAASVAQRVAATFTSAPEKPA